MKFSTKAIRAGQDPDPATGATITPIYQTSTFTQSVLGKTKGFEYSRCGNPTRAALETCLATLEDGQYGYGFGSGLAAETSIMSLLTPGDRILASEDLYGGTYRLFEEVFKPWGIKIDYVNARNLDELKQALTIKTKVLWVESPSNPLLNLVDLTAVSDLAKKAGAITVVDNTFATPYIQQPLNLGANIVVHSTTKYIGGHSDVIGGAVILKDQQLAEKIYFHLNATGGIPGPFDAWLTMRGVKTLAVRMKEHSRNALEVARYLSSHPKAKRVYYPGLETHPQYELAKRQMKEFGGMVSFDIQGGRNEVERFMNALQIFAIADSLGGVESLANYSAEMTQATLTEEERLRRGIGPGLIRLSVGIEDIDDLLADIQQAFDKV